MEEIPLWCLVVIFIILIVMIISFAILLTKGVYIIGEEIKRQGGVKKIIQPYWNGINSNEIEEKE